METRCNVRDRAGEESTRRCAFAPYAAVKPLAFARVIR
jgi:hypothetical protein